MTELVVNEIFHSIQGESTHTGRPCVFVRLTYCNLRCTWCDTPYAFEAGSRMSVEAIVSAVESFRCGLVEVTGGEPLMQEGVHDLFRSLCDRGYEVLVETSGSLDVGGVDRRVRRIVDFKCPGSGMEKKNLWSNVRFLTPQDEVKFVILDRGDFDWAVAKINEYRLDTRCTILMSVVFGELEPVHLARWMLDERINARLQLQVHKFIWEPSARGV
ncbi:MAG TPA: radical SAM protein [Bacteroidota bacterium]|nr:radical SAM protein [Bacteroidota bacterium]